MALRLDIAQSPSLAAEEPMTPRFSLAHLTILGCTPAEATIIAAETGYDYVSFRTIALGLPGEPVYPLASDKAMARQTKAALADTGLTVLDIEVARISDDRAVEDYRAALENAAELGARHVVACAFGKPDRIAEQFAHLCALAAPYGLTIDLEFMPFSDVVDLSAAWRVVRESGAANAGILVDTLHFGRTASSLAELDAIPPRFFHYAQLCDAAAIFSPSREDLIKTARTERLFLGEGVIPVADIVSHLPPIPCSLEIAHLTRQHELGYKEFARQCLVTARRYFDQKQFEGEKFQP
jgi:sugar phosphate isomerase/epimerase